MIIFIVFDSMKLPNYYNILLLSSRINEIEILFFNYFIDLELFAKVVLV